MIIIDNNDEILFSYYKVLFDSLTIPEKERLPEIEPPEAIRQYLIKQRRVVRMERVYATNTIYVDFPKFEDAQNPYHEWWKKRT